MWLLSRMRPRRTVASGLAVVSLVATLLALSFSPVSAENSPTSTPGTETIAGQRIGPTASTQQLQLSLALRINGQADLDNFVSDIYNPTSPNYKHYLTSQEFTQRFTNQSDRAEIDKYLTGQGFKVNDSGLGILVNATGTVALAEKTFGVTISNYKNSLTGKVFFHNDGPINLPSTLASRITSVTGLSNDIHFYPRTAKVSPDKAQPRTNGTPSGCSGAVTTANLYDAFTPNQLKTAYNFDPFYSNNITGTGQTAAVYELDDYLDSNVATYQSCFGTSIPLQRIPVDGGVTTIGLNGQSEVELDIEVLAGMAPGLSKILVYEADGNVHNGNSSYLDEFQAIANDDLAQVVSISWGDCEGNPTITHSFLDTENTIFAQMAAQGQSVFSASGDYGANGCIPINGNTGLYASDILDTPYVTGVGGTKLHLNNDNTISSEITWNDYDTDYGASGGGPSNYFARPSWQVGPGTDGQYSNGFRMTPDVSAAASPYTSYAVFVGDRGNAGSWQPVGGTSASSPLWAAAAALTNNYLAQQGQPALGFANPTIYRIFNFPGDASVFRDITVGDNCYDKTGVPAGHISTCGDPNSGTGIYPATSGYDMATGVGTLNAFNFARNSCMLNVTNSLDSGNGSLRGQVNVAAQANADCKLVGLNPTNVGASTITLSSSLTINNGVTVMGPACSVNGPAFTIQGSGVPGTGITLTKGGLTGVRISGFGGPQLKAQAGPNYINCIKVS